MFIKKLLGKIFSIKNKENYMVVTLFGIKLKIFSTRLYLNELNTKINNIKTLLESNKKEILNYTNRNFDYLVTILGIDQAINKRDIYHNQGILDELLNNQIRLNKRILKISSNNIKLETNYHKAEDSNDNLYPESTLDGAIIKPRFINKIIEIFGEKASLLDIGCGAGGIVFGAIEKGLIAFGIDGSTQNKKLQTGYWQVLPENLLTCDATKPYKFTKKDNTQFKFTVISSWECLEHIPEEKVCGFLDNVYNNIDDNGYFIGSISRMPYENKKLGIIYHVTLKDQNWWKEKFALSGLNMIEIESSPFEYLNFCRGIGLGWQDIHTNYVINKNDGFLFVANKKGR